MVLPDGHRLSLLSADLCLPSHDSDLSGPLRRSPDMSTHRSSGRPLRQDVMRHLQVPLGPGGVSLDGPDTCRRVRTTHEQGSLEDLTSLPPLFIGHRGVTYCVYSCDSGPDTPAVPILTRPTSGS